MNARPQHHSELIAASMVAGIPKAADVFAMTMLQIIVKTWRLSTMQLEFAIANARGMQHSNVQDLKL